MKVGDLVMLSSYARKLKNFYTGRDTDLALIIENKYDVFKI